MAGPRGLAPTADAGVRPARGYDVSAIASVHARAWSASYARALPPELLGDVTPEHIDAIWRDAVARPPSPDHRVLVATADDVVTGFVAVAPAQDDDAEAGDVELLALEVDPAHRGRGHGSRLLNAAVETSRDRGTRRLTAWVPAVDDVRAGFFTDAGFASDGAERVSAAAAGETWHERRWVTYVGAQ